MGISPFDVENFREWREESDRLWWTSWIARRRTVTRPVAFQNFDRTSKWMRPTRVVVLASTSQEGERR